MVESCDTIIDGRPRAGAGAVAHSMGAVMAVSAEELYNEGVDHSRSNRFAEAAESLTKAASLALVPYQAAQTYMYVGSNCQNLRPAPLLTEAAKLYEIAANALEVRRGDPNLPKVLTWLAFVYRDLERRADAIAAAERASAEFNEQSSTLADLDFAQQWEQCLRMLSGLYIESRDWDKAASHAENAILLGEKVDGSASTTATSYFYYALALKKGGAMLKWRAPAKRMRAILDGVPGGAASIEHYNRILAS